MLAAPAVTLASPRDFRKEGGRELISVACRLHEQRRGYVGTAAGGIGPNLEMSFRMREPWTGMACPERVSRISRLSTCIISIRIARRVVPPLPGKEDACMEQQVQASIKAAIEARGGGTSRGEEGTRNPRPSRVDYKPPPSPSLDAVNVCIFLGNTPCVPYESLTSFIGAGPYDEKALVRTRLICQKPWYEHVLYAKIRCAKLDG